MDKQNFNNKVCLITGATSGIGLATAYTFAELGMELYLLCRNSAKGEQVISDIKTQTGNHKLNLLICDLSSLEQVRKTAHTFLELGKPLHLLLNNAGVFNTSRQLTTDGYEEMFAVNHLAHFLLTNLLLERLKSSSSARIVNIASGAHMLVKSINFDDLRFDKGFRALKVYSHSKLANLLFNQELAKRLEGSNVTTNSVDPGEVATGLARHNNRVTKLISIFMKPFLQSPEKGARTSIYVCTSPEVEGVSGRNFRDCREKKPKPWATDNKAALQLWKISTEMVNLTA